MTNISVVNTQSTNYGCHCFESGMLKLCCYISCALNTETQTHPVFSEFIPNLVFLSSTVRISWLMVPTLRRGNELEIHTHISCTRYYKLCLTNIHCTEVNYFIASFACNKLSPQMHTNIWSKLMTSVLHNFHIIHIFIYNSQWAVLAQRCPVHV
jgi:hypothetical protein